MLKNLQEYLGNYICLSQSGKIMDYYQQQFERALTKQMLDWDNRGYH